MKPEILAPAGNLEKLKVAILYGADAVYLSGQNFGLRSAADNFNDYELAEGVSFAHSFNRKVYLTLNGFLHDRDLCELVSYIKLIDSIGIDAVIVSDLGVLEVVKEHCKIPIHLSTQASCINTFAALVWKSMGVTRIVLGREVSIDSAQKIANEVGLEVEMFCHGSMCVAYSGNCVISNFTTGRDSNRGGCAHSCRFEYSLDLGNGVYDQQSYFLSSKDLCGIEQIPAFVSKKIHSLKIEGRMKSPMYAGITAKVYKQAVNDFCESPDLYFSKLNEYRNELDKISHREYCSGNLDKKAEADSIYNEREQAETEWSSIGTIIKIHEGKNIWIEVRKAFEVGQCIEIVPFNNTPISVVISELFDIMNRPITRTKPGTIVTLPWIDYCQVHNLLRLKEEI